jgi:carboxyl-terminal processing protease
MKACAFSMKYSTFSELNTTISESLEDPNTSYLSKEYFQGQFKTETRGEFGGVGIVIGVRDKWITVISPIDDTPGARAGIKSGDKIIEIDGKSTDGLTTMDAVNLIRGKVGTSVTLTIDRESAEKPLYFTIVRGIIRLETVKSMVIDEHIGYIRISQFSEPTAEAMKEQIAQLRQQSIDSLIVDLRNNPGGLLTSAIEISDMFLSSGTIVSTKGRDPSQNQSYEAHENVEVSDDFPLIVMVNEGSASGSEIVAGAIKDHKRGFLVGTKTYGKGSVQTVRELPDGSGIRITIALYYTPSGISIHNIGIEPHEMVEDVEITKEEMNAIEELEEMDLIEKFVNEHGNYTEDDFNRLMKELSQNGILIKPIIVKRLIKNEIEKDVIPSLIDLDYDLQLKHAVNMLKSNKVLLQANL